MSSLGYGMQITPKSMGLESSIDPTLFQAALTSLPQVLRLESFIVSFFASGLERDLTSTPLSLEQRKCLQAIGKRFNIIVNAFDEEVSFDC